MIGAMEFTTRTNISAFSKIAAIAALTATLTLGLATVPVLAAQTDANSTSYTAQKELEFKGYTCGIFYNGRIVCTKEGEPTYWCMGGSCTKRRVTAGNLGTRPILGGSELVVTNAYTPISVTNPRPTIPASFGVFRIVQ